MEKEKAAREAARKTMIEAATKKVLFIYIHINNIIYIFFPYILDTYERFVLLVK